MTKFFQYGLYISLIICGGFSTSVTAKTNYDKKIEKHVKKLKKKHRLKKAAKKITKVEQKLSVTRKEFYQDPAKGIKEISPKQLNKHKKSLQKILEFQQPLESLVQQLETDQLITSVFSKEKNPQSASIKSEKSRLQKKLKQESFVRKKEAQHTLDNLRNVQKQYDNLVADWLLFFSKKELSQLIKSEFEKKYFSDNTRIYREFVNRGKAAYQFIQRDPHKAKKSFQSLRKKLNVPYDDLLNLEKAIEAKSLVKGLEVKVKKEKLQYTKLAKKKIKPVIQSLSEKKLQVIYYQLANWEEMKEFLRVGIEKSDRHIAYLKRKEKKRLKLKERLADITSGKAPPPSEDDSEAEGDEEDNSMESDIGEADRVATVSMLNASFSHGVRKKSGRLKTSQVGSASKKLHVDVDEFDENSVKDEEFDFNIKQDTKFSRITANTRDNLALYTYQANGGRAGNNDLKQFINEVAIISYGANEEFITYRLPSKWKPGKSVQWIKEKFEDKPKNHDRTFTYVELFVEAHKVKKNKPKEGPMVNRKYIAPNMIVFFDEGGGVKRYQSFTDIKRVKIRKSDLTGNQVHYKFLNYHVRGSSIHLNGIDHEIKQASL